LILQVVMVIKNLLCLAKLADIFKDFGLAYKERLYDAVKASLKNSAVTFSVNDYIRNRTLVSKTVLLVPPFVPMWFFDL